MSGKTVLAVLLFLVSAPLLAADFRIVNGDDPGVGLNDATATAPVGGNPGTTLGEQRLNVLNEVGKIWSSQLQSDVTIVISASTVFFDCANGSATLASAGSNFIFNNFPGATSPNTWHHSALADSLAGFDQNSDAADIVTNFNLGLDEDTSCSDFGPWYYGFDHNPGTGADLLAVLLHEFGHGLGFSEFSNGETGALASGLPDVFTNNMHDLSTGKNWNDMTNGERTTAGTNDPNVVWTGPNSTAASADFLTGAPLVRVDAPASIAGNNTAGLANFGPNITNDITAEIVLVDDGSATPSRGCFPLVNDLAGKIALIDRGLCDFVAKALAAQEAGAVAMVVANSDLEGIISMGDNGDGHLVTIPSVMIERQASIAIRGEFTNGPVTVTLTTDSTLAGTSGGFIRLNAPDPFSPGSSLSHWTVDTFPNLLMEPNITDGLMGIDLTTAQLQDIGWTLIAPAEETPQLIYPWLSFNELFNSVLILNNTGSQSANVTLTGRRATGDPFSETVDVPPFGFLERRTDLLFPGLETGSGFSVVAESDSTELAGRWITNGLQTGSEGSPSQGVAVNLADVANKTNGRVGNALLFGYLPVDSETVSGPVIVNAGTATTDVTLYFFDADGNLLDIDEDSVAGLEKFRPFTKVITDLIDAGENISMIAYSPNQPISGVVFVFNQSALEPAIGNAQVIEFTPP